MASEDPGKEPRGWGIPGGALVCEGRRSDSLAVGGGACKVEGKFSL